MFRAEKGEQMEHPKKDKNSAPRLELGVSEIMEDSDRKCERNENGKGNEWKTQLKIFSYRVQITI